MLKKIKKIKKVKEPIITDIIHENINGVEYDVYLSNKKIIKKEISKEQL